MTLRLKPEAIQSFVRIVGCEKFVGKISLNSPDLSQVGEERERSQGFSPRLCAGVKRVPFRDFSVAKKVSIEMTEFCPDF